jgi:hypothetical protein
VYRTLSLLLVLILTAPASAAPNVVVILSDDRDYSDYEPR